MNTTTTKGKQVLAKIEGTQGYDIGGVTSNVTDTKKAVKFFSVKFSQIVMIYHKQETPFGTVNNSTPIQFRNCTFSTDNEVYIDALRKNGCFGGSEANNFTDRSWDGQPLFYEGDYPEDVKAKRKEDNKYMTTEEGLYEGADKVKISQN